ncbi:helix-turn-helix domain-containing protein [Hyphococcus lacteus]|uniref:Helix-turn-helix transcriptional regulator n=1 Tax=Hyphococcus lacteus TaxID=3143536 RepID=A0ABV3Z0H6_9PROT
MNQETMWIQAALDEDPTKSKTGLAHALNVDKSAISRLLRGERRLKFDEAQKAATYLGIDPSGAKTGFQEPDAEFQTEARQVPFYRVAEKKSGIWTLDRSVVIEQRRGPSEFTTAEGVFGLYIPNSDMQPRFRIGETAWINPNRPAAINEDALIMPAQTSNPIVEVFLCCLATSDEEAIIGEQYGSGQEHHFNRAEWQAVHVLGRN